MMNKYGYLRYLDIVAEAKDGASYTTDISLQENSSPAQLGVGVEPYDYASFEKGAYITNRPKKIYTTGNLGILSTELSDNEGKFANPIKITIQLANVFALSGITISSKDIIKDGQITTYEAVDTIGTSQTITATNNIEFYNLSRNAQKIEIIINQIDKPYHFFGLYDISFGRVINFDEKNCTNVEIVRHFSVLGDTIEYDTLDFTLLDNNNEYMILPRQRIEYIKNGKVKANFYIDTAKEEKGVNVSVSCYDDIANLDDKFLGGIYNDYSFVSLINSIFNGKNIEYEIDEVLSDVLVTGYIPITTRRKALQMLLFGTNTRCYKSDKFYIKPLDIATLSTDILEEDIVKNPQKNKAQEFKSVTVNHKIYSKTKEEVELYHWYISTTETVTIEFDSGSPMYNLRAYEVVSVDENGEDVISETQSENVTFVKRGANYCVVKNTSSNKIVIMGKKYKENVQPTTINKFGLATNLEYPEYYFDVQITHNNIEIMETMFELYSRLYSYDFLTLKEVELGENYNILGENLTIKKISTNLNGIYEVEAV